LILLLLLLLLSKGWNQLGVLQQLLLCKGWNQLGVLLLLLLLLKHTPKPLQITPPLFIPLTLELPLLLDNRSLPGSFTDVTLKRL
jgi:hypothetical protein